MTKEANSNEHGNQEPEIWSPTPKEYEKLTLWAGQIQMCPEDLYDESDERWLRDILRETKDLAKLAPFMKQIFLKEFQEEWICASPVSAPPDLLPFPLIGLLLDYVKAQPIEKALINFVLRRLANVTMGMLVHFAVDNLYRSNPQDLDSRS
jgi:hypothetical protein